MGYNTKMDLSKMGWQSTRTALRAVEPCVMSQVPEETLYEQFFNSRERHLMWLLFLC